MKKHHKKTVAVVKEWLSRRHETDGDALEDLQTILDRHFLADDQAVQDMVMNTMALNEEE